MSFCFIGQNFTRLLSIFETTLRSAVHAVVSVHAENTVDEYFASRGRSMRPVLLREIEIAIGRVLGDNMAEAFFNDEQTREMAWMVINSAVQVFMDTQMNETMMRFLYDLPDADGEKICDGHASRVEIAELRNYASVLQKRLEKVEKRSTKLKEKVVASEKKSADLEERMDLIENALAEYFGRCNSDSCKYSQFLFFFFVLFFLLSRRFGRLS